MLIIGVSSVSGGVSEHKEGASISEGSRNHLGVNELRLNQCFDPGALQRPAPPLSRSLGRGSLFASESERFRRDAVDGTLLSVAFRVLCIDNYLAKLC